MRKVLLVDDDDKSLKGIKMMLLRGDTEFKDITECNDGHQAELLLQKDRFDLVITDIKMPNMDGISFIRRSQLIEHKPKFLIMSGYQNFGFAKEALKYGVKEYLLKPVGRHELIESVKKIENELKQEEFFSHEKDQNSVLLSLLTTKEINFIFLNVTLAESEIKHILNRVKLTVFSEGFYIYVADTLNKDSTPMTTEQNDDYNANWLESRFKALKDQVLTFYDVQGRIVFITQQLLDTEKILNLLEKEGSFNYVMGLGEKGTSPGRIRTVYLQALEALKYKVYLDGDKFQKLICYSDIENLSNDYSIPVSSIKKIPEMSGTYMFHEVGALLDNLFCRKTLYLYPIDYAEKMVDYLYNYIFQYFTERMPFEFAFLEQSNRRLKKIENFACIEDYLIAMKKYLDEINHFFCQSLDESKTDKVDIAIQFMKDNFHRDINLTCVANYVSLNYNYFSNVFHLKTEMRFVEYLNLLRINKAKELLGNNENIYEISDKVGFSSPKHFSKIFKSLIGISPNEYRNKQR